MRRYFQLWYADGTIHTGSSLADWKAMPDEGVLVVVEVYDRVYKGRYACARHAYVDYYWMTDEGDISGHCAKYIPFGVSIKRGKQVDDETWMRVYNAACVDPKVNDVPEM